MLILMQVWMPLGVLWRAEHGQLLHRIHERVSLGTTRIYPFQFCRKYVTPGKIFSLGPLLTAS